MEKLGQYVDPKILMAVNILKKEPTKRTKNEIVSLAAQTEHIAFFQKYNISADDSSNFVHKKCCQYMQYEENSVADIVFEMGTVGHKFYVILQGTVGIFIVNQNISKENVRIHREAGSPATYGMILVKQLEIGDQFGELALLNNKPRMATIQCLTNCQFAVLHKKEFNAILKQHELKLMTTKLAEFSSLPICQGWNANLVRYIYLNQFSMFFDKDEPVYLEGQTPQNLYIVKSGEFSVRKNGSTKQIALGQSLMRKRYEKDQKIFIKLIGKGEYFGEEDLILRQDHIMSVYCESHQSELICIRSEDFYHRIYKSDENKRNIDNVIQIRNDVMSNRLDQVQEYQIPQTTIDSNYFSKTSLKTTLKADSKLHFLAKKFVNSSQVFYEMKMQKTLPNDHEDTSLNQQQINIITLIGQTKSKTRQKDIMNQDALLRLMYNGQTKLSIAKHQKSTSFPIKLDPLYFEKLKQTQEKAPQPRPNLMRQMMDKVTKNNSQYYMPSPRRRIPTQNVTNFTRHKTFDLSVRLSQQHFRNRQTSLNPSYMQSPSKHNTSVKRASLNAFSQYDNSLNKAKLDKGQSTEEISIMKINKVDFNKTVNFQSLRQRLENTTNQ